MKRDSSWADSPEQKARLERLAAWKRGEGPNPLATTRSRKERPMQSERQQEADPQILETARAELDYRRRARRVAAETIRDYRHYEPPRDAYPEAFAALREMLQGIIESAPPKPTPFALRAEASRLNAKLREASRRDIRHLPCGDQDAWLDSLDDAKQHIKTLFAAAYLLESEGREA